MSIHCVFINVEAAIPLLTMIRIFYLVILWIPFFVQAQTDLRGGKVANAQERQSTGKRTALVIGNATYKDADKSLRNPVNDARAMSDALQKAQFDVVLKTNVSKRDFDKIIAEWGKTLGQYELALFYYAGHGMEINGKNYLVPTDTNPQSFTQIDGQAISVDSVIDLLESHQVKTKVLLLDACRNNPLSRTWGSYQGGFARMNAPAGTFVGFAASPGKTASDGDRGNGLYTEAILQYLLAPGFTIDQIFNQVNRHVRERSNGAQIPFKNSSLEADLIFVSQPIPVLVPKFVLPEMVLIKGGSFMMGNEEEKSVHSVRVNDFRMSKHEITVTQFAQFVQTEKYKTDAERSSGINTRGGGGGQKGSLNWQQDEEGNFRDSSSYNYPVLHISWHDANAYCQWLSKQTGKSYSLPTEAQWEYAAGNGSLHTKYSWGNEEKIAGNLSGSDDGYLNSAPVGSYAANRLGLFDLSGNVWEWCSDWYSPSYSTTTNVNPKGPANGDTRVLRGGSWSNNLEQARIYSRNFADPSISRNYYGFRVVSSVP